MTESIVGQTVGRIVAGARAATPGNIRDGFIGCIKVSVYKPAKYRYHINRCVIILD